MKGWRSKAGEANERETVDGANIFLAASSAATREGMQGRKRSHEADYRRLMQDEQADSGNGILVILMQAESSNIRHCRKGVQ